MLSAKAIDALLPQTQCGECGFPGCLPYAKALAVGEASIDKCPPGGLSTIQALGKLLNIDSTPYLASAKHRAPALALIREEDCIGCTKCLQACPVDSIIGSAKLMHTVMPDECTGCGLCVEPCPVDCIDMVVQSAPAFDKDKARFRSQARHQRRQGQEEALQIEHREKKQLNAMAHDYIVQAMQRKRTS